MLAGSRPPVQEHSSARLHAAYPPAGVDAWHEWPVPERSNVTNVVKSRSADFQQWQRGGPNYPAATSQLVAEQLGAKSARRAGPRPPEAPQRLPSAPAPDSRAGARQAGGQKPGGKKPRADSNTAPVAHFPSAPGRPAPVGANEQEWRQGQEIDATMEKMSKDINDPFKLLASLWSMVPSVEDQQPRWGPAGEQPPPGQAELCRESPPRSAAPEKASSSSETKSTISGSDDASPPAEETPPSTSRTRP